MINLLTAALPNYLEVEGKKYPIDTDFRTWVTVFDAASKESSLCDLVIFVFPLIFSNGKIPADIFKTLEAIGAFLCPFENRRKNGDDSSPLLSFTLDSPYIYSAFLSQYAIDLTKEDLHWWQFLSLLLSLNRCTLQEIIKIRGMKPSEISDPLERARIRRLKGLYRIGGEDGDFSDEIGKLL